MSQLMQPTSAVIAPWEVDQSLRTLGLTRDLVRSVAIAAASARADALEIDPIGTPGLLAYTYGVRAIRQALLPKGWRVGRDGNVECTVNDRLGVQLMFQNVYRACGAGDPEAISGKGAACRKLVSSGQPDLFQPRLGQRQPLVGQAPTVWLICVSSSPGSVRAEVSCPHEFEGDQFSGFVKRLFVVDETLEPTPSPHTDELQSAEIDFDVTVSKK